MKKILNIFTVFSILFGLFTGCDNFMNSNEDFKNLMETEIDYAKAPLVNVFVGHNNDDFGTVGTGVVNYSVTAKVGYAFEVTFALKASAGNFVGWNAYTKYDPDIPANCKLLDESYIEFVDNSRGKLNAKVKILKEINEQIRLVPEVTAFPVMEVCLPSEFTGISPSPASFNPPQAVKALTPGQEYSITATTTVDYGFSENPDECWKVYRKDSLGNEIEIADGANITIGKNTGTQLANGRSQSTIYITVDEEFSGRFYVSPKLITYPSMKVEIENFDSSLVKMSHSGTVPMAEGTPYEISLQTDSSVGFSGWKLCKRDNITLEETEELIPADNKTTTNINLFTAYSDDYITVSSPSYEVSETGKTAGKVNASIRVTLKQDMDDLDYSYYLLPQFFRYPVVNVLSPEGYASAGRFSLIGAGYLDNDVVRMMMDDYEYTITYKTTEDYSFAEPYWVVYESSDPSRNLLDAGDSRIEVLVSSVVLDESGSSSGSISITLNHNFGTNLYIKPVVSQKPSMNISFEEGTPNGINLSLGGSTITSGSINSKIIKMSTGKTYTATVNVPKGYSFEGWRLVRETSSSDKVNWITESTKTTTDIVESATIDFDTGVSSENPSDYVRLFNAKYTFEHEGRNAGTTKATVDISFKKELSDFSLNLIPIIKAVPEISFVTVNSDYGNLLPSASDVRNLYPETKIDLTFKSTKQATAGKEIWKIKKWDGTAYSIDYSANVGYTTLDLTAALNDEVLKTKDIIIYNNDNEAEVQPNSKGEYITTKTAVLYVNRMPDANLQLSVTPEVYNTIKFVPGTDFEATAYDSEVYIPAGVTFNFAMKTKAGYEYDSMGTPENGSNTKVTVTGQATGYDGISTVSGTIESTKNNGDAVKVTPSATAITKVTFGKPVLSSSLSIEEESSGTMVPAPADFIYQLEGNSTAIRFETSGEYTYQGFAAGNIRFTDVSNTESDSAVYVLSTGTLVQAKEKAPLAKLIIHDLVETELTDSQGQIKKRVTGTLSVVSTGSSETVKPVVAPKPSMNISFDAGTPNGIILSLGGNSITSGSVDHKSMKMTTGKIYTATVNVPKGYSFEGWRLVREIPSGEKLNWITESTKSTTEISENADLAFDSEAGSENPSDYVRLNNVQYSFELEGRNAGITKATVDISFKKELSDFSLSLIPVINVVPEISFVAVDPDHGTLTPAASDVRNLYLGTKIDLSFKSTKRATAGKKIWKIKKWDSGTGAYSDYSEKVGYTDLDLTAALKDDDLKTKDIIIYNNDKEAEVQPNSKGEYITTKTAVLYVNKMPEAKLQVSVIPEVYNTIKFVPGTDFEATAYDSEVYIPAGVTLVYELKSKPGYFLDELVAEGCQELDTWIDEISTDFNGVTTVKGYITLSSNNGDTVVFTPCAIPISKVNFGQPVLSSDVTTTEEDAGSMVPSTSDFIYQVARNSTSIRFETTGEYTYEGFAAGTTKFVDVSKDSNETALYVLSTGTLEKARSKAPKAKIVIHDLVPTELTDNKGQIKKRVTATLTVLEDSYENVTVKPVVKGKPVFCVQVDDSMGSVSPSEQKKLIVGQEYNISYTSSAGYGFNNWKVTKNNEHAWTLTYNQAMGTAPANNSVKAYFINLSDVQELEGDYTLEKILEKLNKNYLDKFVGIIYNVTKTEDPAIEGVERVTAKFVNGNNTDSTIVITPNTYKHSYLNLHLGNSADGRFSPVSRTLMKAGKDYDFEFVFDGDKYSIGDYSLNSASSFSAGTVYGDSDYAQLSDFSISNWTPYSENKFVIYADTISVNESNNVVTRKGKIRLIKEQTDGVEIHIRPSVFPHNKISLEADTENVSKLQINNTISTTGSINSYTMIDHKLMPNKSYSISAIPVSGKAFYENPEKIWILSNDYSADLYDYYGSFEFTNGNYTDCNGKEAVFYNCRLEYAGDNLYKACADVIVNSDEICGFTIKPNVYTMPEFNFNPPVMTDGTKKGTCTVTKNNIQQTGNKVFLDTEYSFTYEAEDGNHISSLELYDGSGNLKKTFDKTDTYEDDDLEITNVSFSSDMKEITGKITFLTESVSGYSFKCNVSKGKPGPVLNIGTGYSYVTYNDIYYLYSGNDESGITQINSDAGTSGIYATQEFNLVEAQKYGYQGKAEREDVGYHIAKERSIKFYINATGLDSTHLPSKVKITERLMYLHPGMVFDYSPEHDYSQYDVIESRIENGIETGGLQLYDENGNYKADSKYKNAGFKFEESTEVNVTSLSGYSKSGNTISGNTAYSNKIPYGGIHQYTVSVLDSEGNESNKFVVYLDVPRTPRTSAEVNSIKGACSESELFDEGLFIKWPNPPYQRGTSPLNKNMRIVYSAGQVQSSTTECSFSATTWKTRLRLYPSNLTFTFKICLSDSNGYATEFMESKEVKSNKVNIGNLVVRDSDTFKFYYISVDQYLRNKNKLEPVAVIVRVSESESDKRVIGAGLYDVGDYPFTNSNIWFNASNSSHTTSTNGKVMLNTWKTNAPYYSAYAYPQSDTNKSVLFTEPNFPAIFKATHYGDVFKTVSGQLCNGWYLPGVGEIPSITQPDYLESINRALRLIDGQLFEYNSDYWTADYAQPDSDSDSRDPRCKTFSTPTDENTNARRNHGVGFIYSTEIHHVRAVFDFTDLAEPWPNN